MIGQLRYPLADRLRHGVAGHDQDGEEHGGQDAGDQRSQVPDLLREAHRELLLGLGLGLVGRVQEAPVDLRRDGAGLGRVGDAHDVPAGLALAEGAGLVEVRDVDQDDVGVGERRRVLGVEDADEVELPVQAAVALRVDLRADRELLPELPAIALHQADAGDGAGARPAEGLALLGGNRELGVHVEVALRFHRESREGVALVLVLGAEPLGVGHADHAGHLLDLARCEMGRSSMME
jgi:hypothetical protein